MYLPTLPTDNLYKFLALSGLLLVIASVLYPRVRLTELALQKNDVAVEISIIELKIASLRNAVDLVKNQAQMSKDDKKILQEQLEIIQIELKKLRGKSNALIIYADDLQFYSNLQSIGLTVGIFLCFIGFVPWYIFVQRPTDAKLCSHQNAGDA